MKKIRAATSKRTRVGFIIGRSDFAKISAIEGIRITASMEADFREFDKNGLSANERRVAIVRKYGRAR